jgi:hypothetical protein
MNKADPDFINTLVCEILRGVRDGLCRFSGASRVAVIYQLSPGDEFYICDPRELLRGHELKIRSTLLTEQRQPVMQEPPPYEHPYRICRQVRRLELDGIIAFGCQSAPVHYQIWCTDHHPELLSKAPIERWLEHAALRFSHDVTNQAELYSGISGWFLREYATHAVLDQITRMRSHTSPTATLDIYEILSAILQISKTREEKKSPHGRLIFMEPESTRELDYLCRFYPDQQPLLTNPKHVRKLLQAVQQFRNKLISDGAHIVGIARGRIDAFHITADFRGLYGFLTVNDQPVCSFADGSYSSSTHQAKLFEIEEALLDYDISGTVRSNLFHIAASIVHHAESEHFGCAIVLDLNEPLGKIAGQNLVAPLDLERSNLLDLACDLARVDGALQIGADGHLHRFGCLLDGEAISGEDRARGARYNSSLRFTAHSPNTIIVVVSSDRRVSVLRDGKKYESHWKLEADGAPCSQTIKLTEWLSDTD